MHTVSQPELIATLITSFFFEVLIRPSKEILFHKKSLVQLWAVGRCLKFLWLWLLRLHRNGLAAMNSVAILPIFEEEPSSGTKYK